MPRELTYRLSFERITKLSRSAGRRTYKAIWVGRWLIIILYIAMLAGLVAYGDRLNR